MAFVTVSEIPAAWWPMIVEVLLIGGLTVSLVAMRLGRRYAARRRERFIAHWQTFIFESLVQPDVDLPRIGPRDWPIFFGYWNRLHLIMRGDANEQLNALARRLGMVPIAKRWLHHPSARFRLMAIMALGHLKEPTAWPLLKRMLDNRLPVLSLAAARALMHIDPVKALPRIVEVLPKHREWPEDKVLQLLSEAGKDASSRGLAEAALRAPSEEAVTLIHFLTALGATGIEPILRQLFDTPVADTVAEAWLEATNDPMDVERVIAYLTSENWRLRAKACKALSRLAMPGDEAHLIACLADSVWWVREHAAQALVDLPFVDADQLGDLQVRLTDPYAMDMLAQKRAEKALA